MPVNEFVRPCCCQNANESLTVTLQYRSEEFYSDRFVDKFDSIKPRWVLFAWNELLSVALPSVEISKCPFCSKELPYLIRRPNDLIPHGKQVFRPRLHNDLVICDTCTLSVQACRCLPPEWNWMPSD